MSSCQALNVDQCHNSNSAAYGPCIASTVLRLQVDGVPDTVRPAAPGLEFTVMVAKIDAYNQTIVTDSSSIIQVTASVEGGEQDAPVILGDSFAILSHVYGNEWDSGQMMQSPDMLLSLRNGSAICPPGYILALDSASQSGGSFVGRGTCQRCQGGTYSIHPLAPAPGLSSRAPACLNCPAGGDCPRGGNEITFRAGTWTARGGMMLLLGCPTGHQLVNSTAGTSSGIFWHDGQQCRPCLRGQYIVDPNKDECRDCPPGANCTINSGTSILPKIPSSQWTVAAGVWTLVGCPPGYYLGESQCLACPASSYCTGDANAPAPCGPDRFAHPGAANSAACNPAVFVSLNIVLLLGREELTVMKQGLLTKAVARAAGGLSADDVVVSGIVQSGTGRRAVQVTISVARPDAGSAAVTTGHIQSNFSGQMAEAGFWDAELTGLEVTACPAGNYLQASRQCANCLAKFFCPGGSMGMQSCPTGTFSRPGANSSTSCLSSVFVSLVVLLSLNENEIYSTASSRFRRAIADVAKVPIDQVVVDIKKVTLMRRMGNEKFESDFLDGCDPINPTTLGTPPFNIDLSSRQEFCSNICRDQPYCLAGCQQQLELWFGQSLCRLEVKLQLEELNFYKRHYSVRSLHGQVPHGNANLRALANASLVTVSADIAVDNTQDASAVASRLDESALNSRLAEQGLQSAKIVSLTIPGRSSTDSLPIPLISGLSVFGFTIIVLCLVGLGYVVGLLREQLWRNAFEKAVSSAKCGDPATPKHLPRALAQHCSPDIVLGKGAFGCVVRATLKKHINRRVAIKVVLPFTKSFKEFEKRQLEREKQVLELFTLRSSPHGVHMDSAVLAPGVELAQLSPLICWFVMEYLEGEDLGRAIQTATLNDKECIRVARDVLAGLKVLHLEGIIHRDIKPENIMRCHVPCDENGQKDHGSLYKLVDFGTAVGVDTKVAKKEMMTITANREMGQGTPPYMSPEMFLYPDKASYPTDLWSLGISLFEVVAGKLPFDAENELLYGFVVAGNLDAKTPALLDYLGDRRSTFDRAFAEVIAKALEKKVVDRFGSADEMHEAVYGCLINSGEAFYSCFISYRVASEAPLARLLFDELNHSVTPAGHRVTVYWDAFRLVKGEDWEEGFATGLLRSLCFLPLLSYGSTAPLAALPADDVLRSNLIAQGWDEQPVKRTRLTGSATDPEDNVLKEFLVAATLLTYWHQKDHRLELERNKILLRLVVKIQNVHHEYRQKAYPILVGRQDPKGHPNYPRMGNFFQIQGGGGQFQDIPSLPTSRAVQAFLSHPDKAGLSSSLADSVLEKSVAWAVGELTRLQGCQLWNVAQDLQLAELSKQQEELVGQGSTGPAVDIGGVKLTVEQRELCQQGFDVEQLRMLKAQVRAKLPDIHEVIDRAMARMADPAGATAYNLATPPPSPQLFGGRPRLDAGLVAQVVAARNS